MVAAMAAYDQLDDQCSPLQEQFGGYDDAMFIDPPDQSSGLLCPVCILVLREPHLMSCCGKHLCKMCLARVKADDKPCPCCNGEQFIAILNKEKNGAILGLKVHCSNRGIGCNWTGELGDMNRHIETKCHYVQEDCPYGCGQCIPRHSIPNHTERECSKRPIEVQLKCLSTDMEERLRAIELKYEEKVAELEKNNTALQATVKEQERKLEEQEQKELENQKQIEEKVAELDKNIVTLETSNTALKAMIKEQEKVLNNQKIMFGAEEIGGKVAELEKNIAVTLETSNTATVKEQERKLDGQQKELGEQEKELMMQKRKRDEHKVMYEEKIAVLEGKMKEQKDEFSKSITIFEEQQKKQELETRNQIKKQAEKEEKKMADQIKQLVEMKNHLEALEVAREGQVGDLEKKLAALEKKLTEQKEDVSESEEHGIKTRGMFSEGLQQLKEVQKVHEDRLTALKGSSDSCINELRKMEKHLKEVDLKLFCEVTVPVSLGNIKYIEKFKESIFKSSINDFSLIECLDGPNPMVKIHGVPISQKSEVTELVSDIKTATFQFPPVKKEVFKYLFGEKEKWKKILMSLDDRADILMCYNPSMKPFTVEVCGSTQGGVRRAVDELKSFRDNTSVEVGGVQVYDYARDKVERYAPSKSVKLVWEEPRTKFTSLLSRAKVTLKGGKYHVQLVQDYIDNLS